MFTKKATLEDLLEILVTVNLISACAAANGGDWDAIFHVLTADGIADYQGFLRGRNHIGFCGTFYEELEEALALSEDFFGIHNRIVLALHQILSVSYELEGNLEKSLEHAQVAIALVPTVCI